MSDQTGKLANILWSFALGAVAGVLAVALLVLLGDFGWNGAVFTGLILALAVGGFLSFVVARPLPTMGEVQARMAAATPAPTPAPAPVPAPEPAPAPAAAAPAGATKPALMTAARNGQPDDLKLIKGVGPKLEQMLHTMGVYHFDQIAGWTADEVAWVDDNLEGFKGRVSRDGWVDQARALAAGGTA